jgi:hypothetical protein
MKTKPAWPQPILVDYDDPKKSRKTACDALEKSTPARC